jgi:hypothetical protein
VSAVLDAASAASRAHGRLWGAARVVCAGHVAGMQALRRALADVDKAEAELSEALELREKERRAQAAPCASYPEHVAANHPSVGRVAK